MDRKIGILANNIELKETIESLYRNDIKDGKIIIDVLDPDRINEQGIDLERKGAKVIIARSDGYRHTVGKVSVPVINMRVATQDILHSIMTAGRINKDIVLVISDMDYFDYNEWKDLIHSKLILEKFYSVEEIQDVVAKYKDKQTEVVIVSGGIPCKYAKKYNLDYSNIITSDATIHETVSWAWEIIDNMYEQNYRNNMLKNILNHVHDAIIAMDTDKKIILFNERAEELLKKDSKEVLEQKLSDIFPELSIMSEVFESREYKHNEIMNIKDIVVTANISTMESDGKVIGALCSFQDITKLQNLEKRIRYELNKKGMVAKYKINDLVAYDPSMKETLARAVQIGRSDSTVLLYGESGTGKEMIAQSIHNMSERCKEPFVAVNCAALTESLLESELFGYEEGAFTGAHKGGKRGLFELAHGGTMFMDEINSVTLNLQTKLLRVLEEKEVMRIGSDYVIPLNIRIIAATNESLEEKIYNGSFRSDLFYRLNILELHIPPLRKRKMDILPLFRYFVSIYSEKSDVPGINKDLEDLLLNYPWHGNVRELRNAAERYVLFGDLNINGSDIIGLGKGHEKKMKDISDTTINNSVNVSLNLKEINRYVELKVIDMLSEQGLSKGEIAKALGISRTSLWNKINNNDVQ